MEDKKRQRRKGKGRLWKGRRGELAPKGWTGSAVPEMQLLAGIACWYVRISLMMSATTTNNGVVL